MSETRKPQVFTRQIMSLIDDLDLDYQSVVMSDLLAAWLVAHESDAEKRDELLARHVELVRNLIPINEMVAGRKH